MGGEGRGGFEEVSESRSPPPTPSSLPLSILRSRPVLSRFYPRVQRSNKIGPLHDPVTWYKITYTGEQIAQWDFQNNAPAFVLEVPLRNLLTSIYNFVPCDRVVQRAYYDKIERCGQSSDTLTRTIEDKKFMKPV